MACADVLLRSIQYGYTGIPTQGQRIVTVISQLAAFVTGAKASALPAAQRERLRLHLADTVVAALAGARIPEGQALHSVGGENDVANQIGRQAAAARLTEIDDIHLASCTTPSAGIVPVALRIAAHVRQFDPDEVASAIWVGTELTTRLGLAINGPQVLYRGIWPTYFAAPVGAAAAAARMLRLTETRTTHALSLALMLVAGGVGRIHGAPSGRWFLYAHAVTGGIAAALAARLGYTGDPELLDKNWLADTHGIAFDREVLTGAVGASSVYSTLSMKPFCSAKQAIAAVEAFRALLQEGLRIEAIETVRVRVPKAYAGMIATRAVPGARQSTMVSVAHQIALAALAPQRLYDVDRSTAPIDPDVAELSAKIEVVPDAALEQFYPQHWPAEVEVEAGGQTLRRRVVAAVGDPEQPLGRAAIDDKAHRVLDPLLGAARVDEWLGLCHHALQDSAACERLARAFADEPSVAE
jgi:2-methylcitrate dehydratase PrpD